MAVTKTKSKSRRAKKRKTCLVPTCGREAIVRGLCSCCQQSARRAIARGEVSEAELLSAKLILPDARGRKDPFKAQLQKLKGKV